MGCWEDGCRNEKAGGVQKIERAWRGLQGVCWFCLVVSVGCMGASFFVPVLKGWFCWGAIENALRIFGWEGNLGKEGTKNYTRPGEISLASSRPRDRFFVGILDGTICGNQPEGKKNSGKKSKSIRYNKKIAGHGFNDARMRSRYERVV